MLRISCYYYKGPQEGHMEEKTRIMELLEDQEEHPVSSLDLDFSNSTLR